MANRKYWLMKSEPETYSIDDLARDGKTSWSGVRNYQARNFMRDEMRVGDLVLFYHSNAEPPGVAGLARVCREAHPEEEGWVMVDVEFMAKFPKLLALDEMKKDPRLAGMLVLKRGMRLSVQPVEKKHYDHIVDRCS